MSNELAVYGLKDMQIMAEAVAHSGLFGMKSPEQALALMLVAQSENQHPATITQDYDIIQGKACRKTHSVMARFQQMGGKVEWHALSDTVADATFSHPAGGALRIQWTIEQARKIGLATKDNWKNYPRAMLRARVIAEGVRAVYPAAIGGMMVSEEATDTPIIERDMGTINGSTGEIIDKKIKELPAYTDEQLDANFDAWRAAINSGKATPQKIIAMVSSKFKLSDNQLETILNMKKEEATDPFVAEMNAAEGAQA
jgi:hypothetical protein